VNELLVVPIVAPVLAAAVLLIVRNRILQRVVSLSILTLSLAISVLVAFRLESGEGIVVSRLGGWPGDIAIVLVADRLATLMLLVSLIVLVVVLVFAIGQRSSDEHSPFYHPSYLILTAGIAQAFLAGDLFNLFVAFELLLIASYVLLMLEGTDDQIRTGTTYVVLNVIESLVLLTGVGLVFAATGTVNMAELAERLGALPDGVRTGLNLLLLVAFGIKAAVFPLFFWLPDSYPASPSSVTAVFAGLLTKVGVYAIIRTETLLFPGGQDTLLLWIAAATMVVGVLGAVAQGQMKRILSFHIVSQIGYMIMGVGIGTRAALAATVFYLLHQIPVKASLFLVEGIVERSTGSSALKDVSGLMRRSGPLAALFLLPVLSLAGLPPFSGFLAKFSLVRAGLADASYWIVGVALAVSLLTLVSMTKIWVSLFWGEERSTVPITGVGILRHHRTMTGATISLVVVTLAIAAAAGPLYEFCTSAADELLDVSRYVNAVTQR
jgi:multicomponent Na+:H+ antiporter subunit D